MNDSFDIYGDLEISAPIAPVSVTTSSTTNPNSDSTSESTNVSSSGSKGVDDERQGNNAETEKVSTKDEDALMKESDVVEQEKDASSVSSTQSGSGDVEMKESPQDSVDSSVGQEKETTRDTGKDVGVNKKSESRENGEEQDARDESLGEVNEAESGEDSRKNAADKPHPEKEILKPIVDVSDRTVIDEEKSLYVYGLTWWTTDEDVEELGRRFGTVKNVYMFDNKSNGKSLGQARIDFLSAIVALQAKLTLEGATLHDSKLTFEVGTEHVDPLSKPQRQKQSPSRHSSISSHPSSSGSGSHRGSPPRHHSSSDTSKRDRSSRSGRSSSATSSKNGGNMRPPPFPAGSMPPFPLPPPPIGGFDQPPMMPMGMGYPMPQGGQYWPGGEMLPPRVNNGLDYPYGRGEGERGRRNDGDLRRQPLRHDPRGEYLGDGRERENFRSTRSSSSATRPSSRSSGRGEGHGSPPRGTSGTNISNSGQKRRRMEGEERESAIAGQSAREARKMKRSRRG